jgi:hypothetical protein
LLTFAFDGPKVNLKILVSFRLVQFFEISDLAMTKVEKVNIAVTYRLGLALKAYLLNIAYEYCKKYKIKLDELPSD